MAKTKKTLKTEAEFVKVFGFKPHGNNKKYQELKKKYDNPLFKNDKQRRLFLEKTIEDTKKVRYVGSTAVKLIIVEDKNKEGDSSNEKLSSFQNRERTENKSIFIEWHSLPFDKRFLI